MAKDSQVNKGQSRQNRDARAAGLSGGTGFAGLVLLMPDGVWKSILLVLAPTITLIISSSWHFFTNEVSIRVADWRIHSETRRVQALVIKLQNQMPPASPALVQQAQQDLNALVLLEVEISKKRVQAIVTS